MTIFIPPTSEASGDVVFTYTSEESRGMAIEPSAKDRETLRTLAARVAELRFAQASGKKLDCG